MKLIDLLVKELPELGGWPDGVTHIEQDYDRELMFYGRGDVRTGVILNKLAIDHRKCGEVGEKITRDQYESALAASKSVVGHDDWIQWAGGDCPVDSDAIVEVKFRNPSLNKFNNDRAGDFTWSHDGFGGDIIAYRLQQPTKSEQVRADAWRSCAGITENDEEADLNECIGQDAVTEWDGEGLPPVGIKCEHCPGGTTQHEWEVVTVAGVHKNTSTGFTDYWLVRENGSSYIVGNPYRFRPLRTEAEKARELAVEAITKSMGVFGVKSASELLYADIAAGKIPGVKLEGK